MAQDAMAALSSWAMNAEMRRVTDFDRYVAAISQARYVMRKVTRIVDEEAKRHGLEPLEHQAMLQTYGAGDQLRTLSQLADRLDVAPALASRVVNGLVKKGLVLRRSAESDKRVTQIEISPQGAELVRQIDQDVHIHIEYFQAQLDNEQRLAALAIFTFYVGLGTPQNLDSLRELSASSGL